MTITDYDSVMALLHVTEGVRLRESDSRDSTVRYLARNPRLSFVAVSSDRIIGCVMCGHDGRRGHLNHLAVAQDFRKQGLGSALVNRCLQRLKELGISKTHIDVLIENESGIAFWKHQGWKLRDDILRSRLNR